LWHAVFKRYNNVAAAQAVVKALDVIRLLVREIKVQIRKGKNPTTTDLPTLNGPKVSKVVEGRGVVLDAVLSPSDHGVAKTYKVWEAYEYMSAAWSADHKDDAADRQTAAQTLRTASEGFF
jgi:hypothetical protein